MTTHRLIGVAVAFAAAPALGKVIPIGPEAFNDFAPLESFESYGDVLDQGGFGDLQVPDLFQFDSGARFLNLGAEDFGSIVDWSVSENTGWGLSLDGGDISFGETTIPSGVAFFGYSELGSTFGFEFPYLMSRFGCYFEAAIFEGVYTGEIRVEAFDIAGESLGSLKAQADGVLGDASLDSWIGLETPIGYPRIARVVFYGDVIALDDMRFEAVPAPAGMGVLAAGAAWTARRRRSNG